MLRRAESIAISILWFGLGGNLAFAQAPVGSILHVEIVNSTLYRRGTAVSSTRAKTQRLRTPIPLRLSQGEPK
jgi:hypothetical protein